MEAKQRKEWTERQKKAVTIIIGIAIFLLISVVGFMAGFFITPKSMENDELADCEIVAQQIYDQSDHGMIEVPYGYSIKRTDTEITVTKDGYSGEVKATLQNGNLIFVRIDGSSERISFGVVGMLVSWVITIIIVVIIAKVTVN